MKIVTLNRLSNDTVEVHFEAIGLFVECPADKSVFFKVMGDIETGKMFAITARQLSVFSNVVAVSLDGREWLTIEELMTTQHNLIRRLGV